MRYYIVASHLTRLYFANFAFEKRKSLACLMISHLVLLNVYEASLTVIVASHLTRLYFANFAFEKRKSLACLMTSHLVLLNVYEARLTVMSNVDPSGTLFGSNRLLPVLVTDDAADECALSYISSHWSIHYQTAAEYEYIPLTVSCSQL